MEIQPTPRFMIIDDDFINNHICRKSIEILYPNAEIQTFLDPKVALDFIRAYAVPYKEKTILFLDINMPFMTGWDVLQEFKKFPESLKNQFTVYILSSSVAYEDKQKAHKCDLVAGFVEKPLTAELLQTLF